MKEPEVRMGAAAYAAACAEFARWAAWGRQTDGAAWEAVVYPLVAVQARRGWARSPLEPLPLAGCAELLVPRVVMPPPALAHYGPTWARPAAGATMAAATALQAQLDAVRAAHPRLDCYGRMHSHPWPHRRPQPSGTDCAEHLSGALASNTAAGLPWALGLIAAAPGPNDPPGAWPIQAYALEAGERLTDLGAVRVVADDDPAIRVALAGPGWATPAGARRQAALAQAGQDDGLSVSGMALHRGWYALAGRSADRPVRLLALPPSFPTQPARRLHLTAAGWQPDPQPWPSPAQRAR